MSEEQRKEVLRRVLALLASEKYPTGQFFNKLTVDGLAGDVDGVIEIVNMFFTVHSCREISPGYLEVQVERISTRNIEVLIHGVVGKIIETFDPDICAALREEHQSLIDQLMDAKRSNKVLMLIWMTEWKIPVEV